MNKNSCLNQEKKKACTWEVDETESFLATLKELHVIKLMDGKKFKTSQIFKKVEETFKNKGYYKTNTQLLDKFRAMKKRYTATIKSLSKSGAGTADKVECPFFDDLHEIFGHRPSVNQSGIDSTVPPPDSDDETSGYCATDNEVSLVTSKGCSGSLKRKLVEYTGCRSSLTPSSTSVRDQRSSSHDSLQISSTPLSPASSYVSEGRSCTSTPSLDSRRLDDLDKLCASSSKKPKTCETPTYPRREGRQAGLKSVMHNFAAQIIESQEKLITKTIEEQRKLDKEMLDQYNSIFLQQTQMLLTGLQDLSSPIPTNYSTLPGVSTLPPPNPLFTETIQNQYHPTLPMIPRLNDKSIQPSTSSWHGTHAAAKPDQTAPTIQKFTTIPPLHSIRSTTVSNPPAVQRPVPPKRQHSNSCYTSAISQSETLSCPPLEEDESDSDIEYADVEYLDYEQND